MCDVISHKNIAPGWGCCRCRRYNGPQNYKCRGCGQEACSSVDHVALAKAANEKFGRPIYKIVDVANPDVKA